MKNALLNIVMVMFAACCCMSCVYDYYPEEVAEENQVTLALNMRLLGYGATRAGEAVLPAERISTLRVVLVDLGLNSSGEKEAEPKVEYNEVLRNISLSGELGNDGIVHLQFPKIRADRQKKIYFLINCEQSYLHLKTYDAEDDAEDDTENDAENGIKLSNDKLYLRGNRTAPPIEDATFVSPLGSYSNNTLEGEELLVPMTAFHSFSVPTIAELEKNYILNANLVYTLPNELYVVRAINKITFDFVNATDKFDFGDNASEPVDLKITKWSISKINTGASYLFGRPDPKKVFSGTNLENLNAPWMQWLKEEADRSRDPNNTPQWLTEYYMPNETADEGVDEAKHTEYVFEPANGGYVLFAPTQNDNTLGTLSTENTTVTLSTEDDPVYFAESRDAVKGQPQQYELSFTVLQKENDEWGNEYTYRATSSLDDWNGPNSFNLQSLFRSTHVKVTVTFRSGLGHPKFEIDVHPYGGYELEPVFGL